MSHQVVASFIEALNANDAPALEAVLDEEFVDHNPNPGHAATRAAFIADKMPALRSAFPDFVIEAKDILVDGDRVAFRWVLSGTNAGPFAGQDATGIAVEFQGMNLERVKDGRIVEHWSVHDAIALFHQLGRLA
jgi:steroid delta-isomerase-like uncharacterized protein